MSKKYGLGLVVIVLLGVVSLVQADDEFPMVYTGDGMTLIVKQWDDDSGAVKGDIQRDGTTFAFAGKMKDHDSESVTGSFIAEGKTYPFTATIDPKTDAIRFNTGNKVYNLKPVENKPDAPAAGGNPLDTPGTPLNPLDMPNAPRNPPETPDAPRNPLEEGPRDQSAQPPVVQNPLDPGASETQNPPRPPEPAAAEKPEVLKLKMVKFNDINMGKPAFTMLIPQDWKAEGHIEWGPMDNPFPQHRVTVKGPDGSAIAFVPAMNMTYFEVNPVPGFPPQPPQGIRTPERPGDFIVSLLSRVPELRNVRLIEDTRDLQGERNLAMQQRAMGMNPNDIRTQLHVITVGYERGNQKMIEQIVTMFALFPGMNTENIRSESWALYTLVSIAAPEEKFAKTREQLYALAGTYRSIPNWWAQQFAVRQEIQKKQHADAMEAIKRRGEFYGQLSDDQFNSWKKSNAVSDKAQKDRIDGIYERQDYKDVDGSNVNLTIHYKHVYSDGSGNLVLTNNSLNKPNDGNYQEIEPVN